MTYTPVVPSSFFIRKSADETTAIDTTFSDDSTLTLSLATGKYLFRAVIYATYYTQSGSKFQFVGTNLVITPQRVRLMQQSPTDTDAPGEAYLHLHDPVIELPAAGLALDPFHLRLAYEFDDPIQLTSAGTIKLQWAQSTSTADVMTVKKQSFMRAIKVG